MQLKYKIFKSTPNFSGKGGKSPLVSDVSPAIQQQKYAKCCDIHLQYALIGIIEESGSDAKMTKVNWYEILNTPKVIRGKIGIMFGEL